MVTEDMDAWFSGRRDSAYYRWLGSQDVPVYRGLYVEDARTLERGWWSLRGCKGVVLDLLGHQGIAEAHLLEIGPGQSIPPFRMALEEVDYVMEGRGLATVWAEGHRKVTFEWQKHSLFRVPTNYLYELSNARGDQPALTLHMSFLPLALSSNPNTDYIFKNPYVDPGELYGGDGTFYSGEARAVQHRNRFSWYGNFFPDLTHWDKLSAYGNPGRLAYSGGIRFPNSTMSPGLMVLPSRRYRAAHRHGAGITIVGIQDAEGFVIMWPEGGEHVLLPWQEGAIFVPPSLWYHIHANTGAVENRQLRMFPPLAVWDINRKVDPKRVIPLVEEEPWIRRKFEDDLAKHGLTSLMPEEAYTNPNFQWSEEWLKED